MALSFKSTSEAFLPLVYLNQSIAGSTVKRGGDLLFSTFPTEEEETFSHLLIRAYVTLAKSLR